MEKFTLVPFDEESKILINHIEKTFQVEKVESVYFMSAVAGHEIGTYNVKKLYLAKNIVISDNVDNVNLASVNFYDNANVIQFQITNSSCYWDNAANLSHFITNYFTLKNILFSRFDFTNYNRFYMVGYRITLK